MLKKLALAAPIFLCFLFVFHTVHAQVVINEIMYDLPGTDADHEWVEIFNSGGSDADITGWKFNDGSNHNLNQPPQNGGQGSFLIPAGGYAILSGDAATFLADHPAYSGTVIDTVMSLNNTAATLKLIESDGTTESDSVDYNSSQGAAGDGNSLQFIGGSWVANTPTPGAANQPPPPGGGAPLVGNPPSGGGQAASSGSGSADVAATPPQPQSIKVKVSTKSVVAFAHIPFSFDTLATGYSGETLYTGKYFWNFGDGSSLEIMKAKTPGDHFVHTYLYPGDYSVSMEYFVNTYGEVPDVVSKTKVKVVPIQISVNAKEDNGNLFVELANNSDYEMDLSAWQLSSLDKTFTFPRDSSIAAKNKIVLPSPITNFTLADKDSLKLLTPAGEVISGIISTIAPAVQAKASSAYNSYVTASAVASADKTQIASTPAEADLNANVISATDIPARESDSSGPYVFYGVFALFILAAGGAVYLLRRKKPALPAADDFEILDE